MALSICSRRENGAQWGCEDNMIAFPIIWNTGFEFPTYVRVAAKIGREGALGAIGWG